MFSARPKSRRLVRRVLTSTLAVLVATAGLAHAEPVTQTGQQAARSLQGASEVFNRMFGDHAGNGENRLKSKVLGLFQAKLKNENAYPYSTTHSMSATASRQTGRSVREERWRASATLDTNTWVSKISFDPATGHGRLKASLVTTKHSNGGETFEGGSLSSGKGGKRIFHIQGDASRYTATLVGPSEQLQPRKVKGWVARLRLGREPQALPKDLRDAVLDGKQVTMFKVSTRKSHQPQRSLPQEVRPPTQTTREVKIGYVVGTSGSASWINPAQVRTLRAAVTRRR